MTRIRITACKFTFIAKLEEERAPRTCEWFLKQLPFKTRMLQARFSGRATVISIRDLGREVGFENTTSYPSRGDILMYHGVPGINEGEILIPYGTTCFAGPTGQLQGNYFLTLVEGAENLEEMGRITRWEGVQEIVFEKLEQ